MYCLCRFKDMWQPNLRWKSEILEVMFLLVILEESRRNKMKFKKYDNQKNIDEVNHRTIRVLLKFGSK